MGDIAQRDPNRVTSIQGVSSVDGKTPTNIWVNPTSHGIIIDAASTYSSLDTRYQKLNITDTKANILAMTAASGLVAYATDTDELLFADGTNWKNHVHTQYLETTTANTTYLKLDASNGPVTGAITFQNTTDSTTALQVNQADGTNVFNINTSSLQASVGEVQSGIDGRTRLFLRNRTDNVNIPALVIGNLAGTQSVGFGINSNGWMQFTSTQNRASFIVNITEFGVGNAFTIGFFYGYYTNRFEFANRTGKLIFGSSSTTTGDYIQTMTLEDYRAGINIGNATPNGAFEIVGAEDVKQLIVKANATQTANLTEWQNSAGTVLSVVDESGNIGVGLSSPTSRVDILSAPGEIGLKVGAQVGQNPTLDLSDGDVSTPDYSGLFSPNVGANTNGRFTSFSGAGGMQVVGFTEVNNTGSPLALVGYHGGTSPTTAAIRLAGYKHNGATSRTALSGTEVVLDIEAGFNTTLVRVLASGNVGIGTTSPAAKLQINTGTAGTIGQIVRGASSQTANLTEWQNSSGTPLVSVSATGMFTTAGRRKAVTTKTADYTATVNDEVIKFTSDATLTLPSATGSGQHYLVRAVGCTVTIDASGTQTINEELTQTLNAGDSVQIVDDGVGTWGVY